MSSAAGIPLCPSHEAYRDLGVTLATTRADDTTRAATESLVIRPEKLQKNSRLELF